ncbi:transmembrane protein, partial [Cystoisospora suis]
MIAYPHPGAAAADEAAVADQVGATLPSTEDEERRELLQGETSHGDSPGKSADEEDEEEGEGEGEIDEQMKRRQLQFQRMQVEHRRYIKRMRHMEKLYGRLSRVRYITSMGIALGLSSLLLLSLFFLLSVLWDPTKYGVLFNTASLLVKSFGGAVFMMVMVGMVLSISMMCIFRVGTLLFFISFYIKSFLFSILLASICTAYSGLLQTVFFSSSPPSSSGFTTSSHLSQFNPIPYLLLGLALLTHGVCTATPHLWAWILLPLMVISQTFLILFFHPSLLTPPATGILGSFLALLGSSPSWISFFLLMLLHTFRAGLYSTALNFKNQISFFRPPNACIIQPPSATVSPPKAPLHNTATVPSPLVTQPHVQGLAAEHESLQKERLIPASLSNQENLTISELAGSADQSTVPLPPPQPSSGAPTSAADFLSGPPNSGVDTVAGTRKNEDPGETRTKKRKSSGHHAVLRNAGDRRKKRTEDFRTFLRKIIWRHLLTALGCCCIGTGILLVSIHLGKDGFKLSSSLPIQLSATPPEMTGKSFLHLREADPPESMAMENHQEDSFDSRGNQAQEQGQNVGDADRTPRFFRRRKRRHEAKSLLSSHGPITVSLPLGFIEQDAKTPRPPQEKGIPSGDQEDTTEVYIHPVSREDGNFLNQKLPSRSFLRRPAPNRSLQGSVLFLRPTSLALASAFSPSFMSSDLLFHQFADRESSQRTGRQDGSSNNKSIGVRNKEEKAGFPYSIASESIDRVLSFLHLGTQESQQDLLPGQPGPSSLFLAGLLLLACGGVLVSIQIVWLLST